MTGSGSRRALRGTLAALGAAALFGATTPLVKTYGRGLGPFSTAALLYLGAFAASAFGGSGEKTRFTKLQFARIFGAATLGASIAPALFAWGLARVQGSSGSLLLTSETLATVVLARVILGERIGARVVLALALIAAGTVILVGTRTGGDPAGASAIVAATTCWAADNVITRPLADVDPLRVVRYKSLFGAALSIAVAAAAEGPPHIDAFAALALLVSGAFGYGLSLRAYLAAQREIGAARTGSVFAVAPFVAAIAASLSVWESPPWSTYVAAAPIALGIALHATERQRHRHGPLAHDHLHRHDDREHAHTHDPPFVGEHAHPHEHDAVEHEHDHDDDGHEH